MWLACPAMLLSFATKKYDDLMVSLQHIATNNRKQVVEALRVAINAVAPGQATVAALSPPRGRQMKPWVSSGDGDSRHTQAISPPHFSHGSHG